VEDVRLDPPAPLDQEVAEALQDCLRGGRAVRDMHS